MHRSISACALLLPVVLAACSGGDSQPAASADAGADTGADAGAVFHCDAATRDGAVGATDGFTSAGGLHFNVRTPPGYDATVGSPLLVMYAPSGNTATSIENLTGLTPDAASAGYVIAYTDTVSPVDASGVADAATIPGQVAARWCIDPARIYLSGSSDGASDVYEIVLDPAISPHPAAIAPYAAGVNKDEIAKSGVACLVPPLPVMVMHNSGDTVFPGFGASARDWWIACNACGDPITLPDGCLAYQGCADNAEIRYCEGPGGHGHWPGLNVSMFEFFSAHPGPAH